MEATRTGLILSASPALVALGLYYSLAIHMHRSLGGWPSSIGEAGFPPALLLHATVATNYLWLLSALSVLTVPAAFVLCLWVSRWRHLALYLAWYAFVFGICISVMLLAPKPYLSWWRD